MSTDLALFTHRSDIHNTRRNGDLSSRWRQTLGVFLRSDSTNGRQSLDWPTEICPDIYLRKLRRGECFACGMSHRTTLFVSLFSSRCIFTVACPTVTASVPVFIDHWSWHTVALFTHRSDIHNTRRNGDLSSRWRQTLGVFLRSDSTNGWQSLDWPTEICPDIYLRKLRRGECFACGMSHRTTLFVSLFSSRCIFTVARPTVTASVPVFIDHWSWHTG